MKPNGILRLGAAALIPASLVTLASDGCAATRSQHAQAPTVSIQARDWSTSSKASVTTTGTEVAGGRSFRLRDSVVGLRSGTSSRSGLYLMLISPVRVTCKDMQRSPRFRQGEIVVVILPTGTGGLKSGHQTAELHIGDIGLNSLSAPLRVLVTSAPVRRGAAWLGRLFLPPIRTGGRRYAVDVRFVSRWCGGV